MVFFMTRYQPYGCIEAAFNMYGIGYMIILRIPWWSLDMSRIEGLP